MTSFIKKNLFPILLILSIPVFLRPSIHGNDGILNYLYLRSFIIDGDIDFANDYKAYDELTENKFKLSEKPVSSVTGKLENRYGIGSSILWAPLWLIARGADNILKLSPEDSFSGTSKIYIAAVSLSSALYALIGIYLLFRIIEKYIGRKEAWLASLMIWLSTPLFFYMYFHPSMSHANSFFLSAAAYASVMLPSQIKKRHIFLTAFFSGLLCLTRMQDVLFAAPILPGIIYILKKDSRPIKEIIQAAAIYAITFFVMLIPQCLVWKYLYGSYFSGPAPYLEYEEFKLYYPMHFLQVLFSSKHGLFFWHPILLCGVAGYFFCKKNKARPGIFLNMLFLGLILEYYLFSCWSEWSAGASFGHRFFISSLPAFAFGFAFFSSFILKHISFRKCLIIIILFSLWNFGLIIQYGKNMIPRENYVSVKTILKNQFVEIPGLIIDKLRGSK